MGDQNPKFIIRHDEDLLDVFEDIQNRPDEYPTELLSEDGQVVGYMVGVERMKKIFSACEQAAIWNLTHGSHHDSIRAAGKIIHIDPIGENEYG